MDYAALKVRILGDASLAEALGPASVEGVPGLHPWSYDAAIAQAVSQDTTLTMGMLERAKLIQWVTSTGHRRLIEQHGANMNSPVCDIALTLKDILAGALENVDLADAGNMAMLDKWIASTVDEASRQAMKSSLVALATSEEPSWPGLTHIDIAKALRG